MNLTLPKLSARIVQGVRLGPETEILYDLLKEARDDIKAALASTTAADIERTALLEKVCEISNKLDKHLEFHSTHKQGIVGNLVELIKAQPLFMAFFALITLVFGASGVVEVIQAFKEFM